MGGGGRGAGARAAGACQPDAAFPDPHPEAVGAVQFGDADVGALWKERIVLEPWSEGGEVDRRDLGN